MDKSDKPLVFVALDYDSQLENIEAVKYLAQKVPSRNYGFKVNLDSVADFSSLARNSYSFIREIKNFGKPLFVDMKMWNGGRTMSNIAEGCADLGVDIINMYPHAGGKFIQRVKGTLEGSSTKLFTLTVLTHYTDEDTQALYGCNIDEAVNRLARIGIDNGADGIIVPGNHIGNWRYQGVDILSPGIRPRWYEDKKANSQEQTVTPSEAVKNGANHIVVGSPIFKSDDPAKALERVLREVA